MLRLLLRQVLRQGLRGFRNIASSSNSSSVSAQRCAEATRRAFPSFIKSLACASICFSVALSPRNIMASLIAFCAATIILATLGIPKLTSSRCLSFFPLVSHIRSPMIQRWFKVMIFVYFVIMFGAFFITNITRKNSIGF